MQFFLTPPCARARTRVPDKHPYKQGRGFRFSAGTRARECHTSNPIHPPKPRRQERYYSITHLSRNDMIYKFALVVTIVVVSQLPYPQSAIAPDR